MDNTEDRTAVLKRAIHRAIQSPEFLVFVVTLIAYTALIRTEITYGDGPELLTAAYMLGGPHPSGYPLFTMLGYIPSHLPVFTPFFNLAFALSALPGAVSVTALVAILRKLDVAVPIAIIAAGAWGANTHVVYQSTRVEVYSLHCMFIALTFWAMLTFAKGGTLRWAYLTVLFVCLGLTNHLTSVFLVVPVTVALVLIRRQEILKPKPIAIMFGIAGACASVYGYLPLQAMANTGDRMSWNDTQTFERFWFHVSGAEYSIFRRYDKILPTLEKYATSLDQSFFPGVLLACIVGAYEWATKHWKVLFVVVGFELTYLGYVGTYPIRDVATYYTALYIPIALLIGVAGQWFADKRFFEKHSAPIHQKMGQAALVAGYIWIAGLYYNSISNRWREGLAGGMSEQVVADLKEPALVFASVDGHSFPMWYQKYVEHPDEKFVMVDTVMYHLKKQGVVPGLLHQMVSMGQLAAGRSRHRGPVAEVARR